MYLRDCLYFLDPASSRLSRGRSVLPDHLFRSIVVLLPSVFTELGSNDGELRRSVARRSDEEENAVVRR